MSTREGHPELTLPAPSDQLNSMCHHQSAVPMTVLAFKIRRGTQGTFTTPSRVVWSDRHLYKRKQRKGVKNSKFGPENPVYSPPTVPPKPEDNLFVFIDLKIGRMVPSLAPRRTLGSTGGGD